MEEKSSFNGKRGSDKRKCPRNLLDQGVRRKRPNASLGPFWRGREVWGKGDLEQRGEKKKNCVSEEVKNLQKKPTEMYTPEKAQNK